MSATLKSIIDANPDLGHGPLPAPKPGASVTRIQTVRAQQPGGELMGYIQSDSLTWFEQMYRVLPPVGVYNAIPSKPVTITMGAFKVPQSMVLVILDYSFDIYRFSGAAAGDFVPVENGRLSTQVGWDIKIGNNRPSNLRFQIIPQVQSQAQQAFPVTTTGAPPQAFQFDLARAQSNQGPAGPALALLPQRRHRNGLVKVANQYVVKSSEVLSVTCSIINRIRIPLGFFEADICGLLLAQNVYDAYQASIVPIGNPLVNNIPGAP